MQTVIIKSSLKEAKEMNSKNLPVLVLNDTVLLPSSEIRMTFDANLEKAKLLLVKLLPDFMSLLSIILFVFIGCMRSLFIFDFLPEEETLSVLLT